ncbi:MAG: hypothetical protein GQ574_19035 [Crocinitomix sp.]|nr:hypothetical protein [Crocinitomix sp.]
MILCITHSNDLYTIDNVMAYFSQNNIKALRINTDDFLTDLSIVSTLDDNGSEVVVSSKAFSFKLSEVSGVWFRKIWQPRILDEIAADYRANVGGEINTTLSSFFQLLEKQAPCINVLSKARKIEGNKFDQLCQAKEVGLLTPDTIITSDFESVKQFYAKHDGNIIAKLQNSLSFSMGAGERFFPTTQINEENLELLEDTLSCCPMIFQNNIPKAYELRIAYIEGKCFTGKIDASKSDKGKQDWRYSENKVTFWAPYELPIAEVKKIDELMKRFELSFGAIDVICQPNGEYVFLEVNPSGEWGMLEKELGYPIAATIAKTLLNRIENYEK